MTAAEQPLDFPVGGLEYSVEAGAAMAQSVTAINAIPNEYPDEKLLILARVVRIVRDAELPTTAIAARVDSPQNEW